jgi:4-amino-4-deoxy-L-arabinose transferase-like glycosyltransferase
MHAQRMRALGRACAPELALLALCVPILFWGLGSYSLVNGDEAFYQGVAEHMVESGNWFELEFRSQPRIYDTFMNAPLQYWARALLIAVFGSNLWTTRVLSALFGAATVLMTVRLGRRLGDARSAFLAGLVQLTTFQFVFLHSARTGELETVVSFLLVLLALLFQRSVETGSGFVRHHLCLVALVGLKVPLVAIPIAAELAAFALLPGTRAQFGRWARTGLAVLPLALLWHVPQAIVLWDEFRAVAERMAGEAAGSREAGAGRGVSNLLYYGKAVLFGAHPYVFVYPVAVAAVLWRRRSAEERQRWQRVALYPLAVLGFYLLVAKSAPWYVIPAYPFLSLFLGRWLADLRESGASTVELIALAAVGALLAWSDVQAGSFNPFWTDAVHLAMPFTWRSAGALGPVPGVAVTALGLAAALFLLRRALGQRRASSLAWCATGILVGLALLRVCLALSHLGHQSEMARIHDRVRARQAAGLPLDFPITVGGGSAYLVRYYFVDDFKVRITTVPRGPTQAPLVVYQLAGERRGVSPIGPREPATRRDSPRSLR